MLVKDLKDLARNLGVKNYNKLKKQELIEAIDNAKQSMISKPSDQYEIILKNKETTLKYPIEASSKQDAVNELHKLLRLPNHNQYKELSILKDDQIILNITR